MRYFELIPTNGRKSFYGKAIISIDENGTETLLSYGVPIIERRKDGTMKRLYTGFTQTTGTHIKSFCGLNKKQFLDMEV